MVILNYIYLLKHKEEALVQQQEEEKKKMEKALQEFQE